MAGSPAAQRRYGSIILSVACIAVAAAVGWSLFAKRADSLASAQKGEVTGSIGQEAPKPLPPDLHGKTIIIDDTTRSQPSKP